MTTQDIHLGADLSDIKLRAPKNDDKATTETETGAEDGYTSSKIHKLVESAKGEEKTLALEEQLEKTREERELAPVIAQMEHERIIRELLDENEKENGGLFAGLTGITVSNPDVPRVAMNVTERNPAKGMALDA